MKTTQQRFLSGLGVTSLLILATSIKGAPPGDGDAGPAPAPSQPEPLPDIPKGNPNGSQPRLNAYQESATK